MAVVPGSLHLLQGVPVTAPSLEFFFFDSVYSLLASGWPLWLLLF